MLKPRRASSKQWAESTQNRPVDKKDCHRASLLRIRPPFLENGNSHEKTGFPRIKYGAGLIKSGMTQSVKSFLRHYLRGNGLGQGRQVEI
jgi:hypothetical protein